MWTLVSQGAAQVVAAKEEDFMPKKADQRVVEVKEDGRAKAEEREAPVEEVEEKAKTKKEKKRPLAEVTDAADDGEDEEKEKKKKKKAKKEG